MWKRWLEAKFEGRVSFQPKDRERQSRAMKRLTESSCVGVCGCGAVNRRRTSRASDLGVCREARLSGYREEFGRWKVKRDGRGGIRGY